MDASDLSSVYLFLSLGLPRVSYPNGNIYLDVVGSTSVENRRPVGMSTDGGVVGTRKRATSYL